MLTQRPFEELNLWQRIFVEHWDEFAAGYERERGRRVPKHWHCPACGSTKMLLIRIWSKVAGLVYELAQDGLSGGHAVQKPNPLIDELPVGPEQLAFAF